jgi:hypothetical protein
MKDEFNDNADPRAHHYILKLSLTAGVDRSENPRDKDKPAFQQAVLFLQRVKKWAEQRGESFTAEPLPVSDDCYPRARITCPPALMADIRNFFAPKISRVDEIPLPKPRPAHKSIWKRIFGG